jgi:hypothetical protein
MVPFGHDCRALPTTQVLHAFFCLQVKSVSGAMVNEMGPRMESNRGHEGTPHRTWGLSYSRVKITFQFQVWDMVHRGPRVKTRSQYHIEFCVIIAQFPLHFRT